MDSSHIRSGIKEFLANCLLAQNGKNHSGITTAHESNQRKFESVISAVEFDKLVNCWSRIDPDPGI